MRPLRLTALLLLLGACSSPLELSVDVRSDFAPGTEVVAAEVTLTRAQGGLIANETLTLGRSDDLFEGVRLLDAAGLAPGDYAVEVALRDANREVVGRRRELTLLDDLAITVLLTRDCADVACADGTACIGGECEPLDCGPGDVTTCPAPRCQVSAECRPQEGCFRPECVLGQCLHVPDPMACGSLDGGLDAGVDGAVEAGVVLDGGVDAGCAAAEICDNVGDDDCDGMADCADPECAASTCMDDGNDCTLDVCVAGACAHNAQPDGTLISGWMRCCGGAVTDLSADRNNCGACGSQCSGSFDCTLEFDEPTCDCTNLNSQCHGGANWVCSTAYFVCACLPGRGACPGAAVCIDEPGGPNYCEYP